MTNDTLGLVDGAYVSFGNIGSGYIYPLPTNQITYRSPDMSGFKLAVGFIDPSRTATTTDAAGDLVIDAAAEESAPRIEGELTYNRAFSDSSSINVWGGFMQQKSEGVSENVDTRGFSYGAKLKVGGLSLHASGYDGEGVGFLVGPADNKGLGLLGLGVVTENGEEVDSSGHLAQAAYTMGNTRAVISYGLSEIDNAAKWENETTTVAVFHSFYPNLIGVVEFTQNEISIDASQTVEETDSINIGLIINF